MIKVCDNDNSSSLLGFVIEIYVNVASLIEIYVNIASLIEICMNIASFVQVLFLLWCPVYWYCSHLKYSISLFTTWNDIYVETHKIKVL